MNNTILVTGASGLIGRPLTSMLLQHGYTVHQLSRNPQHHGNPKIKTFKWDVEKNEIDKNCLVDVTAIIHLAGEGIAEKRWTESRKEKIVKSRTQSTALLYNLLKQTPNHQVHTFISSSAIGFYGDRGTEILTEESPAGDGFLPVTCIGWEKSVDEGIDLNIRVVKLRTGIVLSQKGGALPEMAAPIKKGFGSPLGSGNQWMSWVHILDAVRMYVFVLENQNLQGVYNMTSPKPVTNTEMTRSLANIFDRKIWLPKVPAVALKILLGEMSALVLDSANVSSEKIRSAGFKFKFTELNDALKEIYLE